MDIYGGDMDGYPGFPRRGNRMRFLDQNGYDREREEARKVMKKGDVFTVKSCNVGRERSSMEFVELAGHWNTVMFEFADAKPASPTAEMWQTMESVPKDGREVLLQVKSRAGIPGRLLVGHYMQGGHCIEDHPPIDRGWYFWNGCQFDKASEPVAWMPLPEPMEIPNVG